MARWVSSPGIWPPRGLGGPPARRNEEVSRGESALLWTMGLFAAIQEPCLQGWLS